MKRTPSKRMQSPKNGFKSEQENQPPVIEVRWHWEEEEEEEEPPNFLRIMLT